MPAQLHGTRNAGTTNIIKPVAIPRGGMMIFLADTAVRDSRTRQIITTIAPTMELISDATLRGTMIMKENSLKSKTARVSRRSRIPDKYLFLIILSELPVCLRFS